MAKPVLLTVDDDREVLRAIERDLRRKYGSDYRVLRAGSGPEALEIVRELKIRNNSIALFLIDQRMPGMSGVEFLAQAITLFPDAKRVLLTAYADTDAAIAAINEAGINHYLLKPWDPPEENLYPVLDELLEDWEAAFPPQFEGIRVLGNRWSPASHNIKDFLARNHVPYQWLDIETAASDSEVRSLVELLDEEETRSLPIVILPNGVRLRQPSLADLAEHAGLKTRATEAFYDLAIVGGGPAGLAAAVYGASEGLRTVMIEREAPGGQAGMSSRIENYLGFPSGLTGADLARRAVVQARRFGVEIISAEATAVRVDGPYRFLKLANGAELSCHALLVATGVQWRKLDAPGVERLNRRGHLLRRGNDRSNVDEGRGRLRCRRREQCGTSRDALFEVRAASRHARARLVARGFDVAIPDQSTQSDSKHSNRIQHVRRRGARRRSSRSDFDSLLRDERDKQSTRQLAVHHDRRGAKHRLACEHRGTR